MEVVLERLWASRILTALPLLEQRMPTLRGGGPLGVLEWPDTELLPPQLPAASPHQRLSLLHYSPGSWCPFPPSTCTQVHYSPAPRTLEPCTSNTSFSLRSAFFFFIYSVPPYLLIHLQGQLFLLVAQARNLGIILGDSLSLPRPVCQICGLFLQVLVSSTLPPWPEPPPRPGYSQ